MPDTPRADLLAELERAGTSIGVYKDIAALLLRAAAELRWIDEILARRDALDGFPSRAEKIEHAINVAKKADGLAAEVAALRQDRERLMKIADDHDTLCSDLVEAQEALVLLANQLERSSVPFVPEAERATAQARRALERDVVLLAAGMKAASIARLAARQADSGRRATVQDRTDAVRHWMKSEAGADEMEAADPVYRRGHEVSRNCPCDRCDAWFRVHGDDDGEG